MCIHICIYIHIHMYIYISIEKKAYGVPAPENTGFQSPPQNAFPARVWATFRLRSAGQIASSLGFGPLFAQDRQHRAQDRPKTANIGPKSGPRPPTWGPRAAQDRPLRHREQPKTAYRGPSASRPTINRKYRRKIHRQNMLPVNFVHDDYTTVLHFSIAVKR